MLNTYCVDLGVSQHWAGFRLFLEAGQVFGHNWRAKAQRLHPLPLGFQGPFRKNKISGKASPGLKKRSQLPVSSESYGQRCAFH